MKGLMFSADSMRAHQAGQKTHTRRVMKEALDPSGAWADAVVRHALNGTFYAWWGEDKDWEAETRWCYPESPGFKPSYAPGEIVHLKEPLVRSEAGGVLYAADRCPAMPDGESRSWGWKRDALPAMFMPNWAARDWVHITEARAERVQEITEDDALAEGIRYSDVAKPWFVAEAWFYGRTLLGLRETTDTAREAYAALWDIINAKRGFRWADNPWVWRYVFERVEKPEEE